MRCFWLVAIALASLPVVGLDAWEQVKADNSLTVYTQQVSGSVYKSFKAVGLVPSEPEKLLDILKDVSRYQQWFAYSNSVRLLQGSQNENENEN